jgi:hypothetical protein
VPGDAVIGTNPGALHDPYGGLVKDACLVTCSALVWYLSGRTVNNTTIKLKYEN